MMENKKYFCINCFEDENIKGFIQNHGKLVEDKAFKCGFCQVAEWKHNATYNIEEYDRKIFKSDKIYVIERGSFIQKIIEIINKNFDYVESPKYNEKTKLINLVEILSNKLFHDSSDVLHRIATYDFIKYNEFPFNTSHTLEQEIHWIECWKQKHNISWKEFKEHTKHTARYFEHEKNDFKLSQKLEPFKKLFKSLEKNLENQKVYRTRIISKEQLDYEIKKENTNTSKTDILKNLLGKAPKEVVKNNRFSPIGISYGYFSFDEKTAIHEVRAELNKEVAIGTFELKKKLFVVDFTKLYSLSSELYEKKDMNPFDIDNFNILLTDIYEFITDISKPINDSDTILEYIPTQIMAEYIWSLEYDGFIFDSSQNKGGENLVLFGDNPNYKSHKFLKIKEKNVTYKYEETL